MKKMGRRRQNNSAMENPAARDRTAGDSHSKGRASLLLAAAFLVLVAVTVLAGKTPAAVLGFYLVASMLAFLAYALDKSAARNDRWRTRERTLHMFSLAGGWPGALFAQRFLRHKTKKASFQVMFRVTVAINCGAFVWLLSPEGAETLRTILSNA